MATVFASSVRASSAELSLRELLEQPVTELLGVGQDAASALRAVGVETIFDLGTSAVFARAAAAVAAESSRLGMLPADVLDAGSQNVAIADVPELPIQRLRGVSAAQGTALADALEAPTLRDFALWPPRVVAHELVSVAAGTTFGEEADDTAEELRPSLGEYPTERVYYDTLVMLGTDPPQNQTPLGQPISLDTLAQPGGIGFGTPAIGALATYAQSWFAQGVTLGHMVHSLALAPGEATRVAVIDWSRRTTTTATESIEERERLDNATSHSRAASEVQNAVANEMQSGGSIATGWAKSTSDASGFAGSIGGGVAGMYEGVTGVLGFGFGGSSSSQESETNSRATSTSWSVGSRSVMAGMTQHVNDRTEQHSTSVRNRRATAVREVSQTEHEQVSTRIVANYNHMHALTVQYYEVVQIYRVSVGLNNFVRTLFLPFNLLDFSGANAPDLVARFRSQLLAGALTRRAAELLFDDRGRIEVRSSVRVPLPISIGALSEVSGMAGASGRMVMMRPAGGAGASSGTTDGPMIADGPAVATEGTGGTTPTTPGSRFTVVRPGPLAEILPGDARLVSIAFEAVGIDRVRVDQPGVAAEASTFVVPAATDQVDFANPIPFRSIESIDVARDASAASEGSMVIRYDSDGRQHFAVVPLSLASGTHMQKAAFLRGDAADRRAELMAHLQANRSHYTQAVLARLDAASLAMLLSGISWLGKPLADQIEPNPIAVTGNYLVLRAPAEDDEPSGIGNDTWAQLMRKRGVEFGTQNTRLVPIPTGGVFAEAVLGRSNSAEKLDITRFWNWQDSPIPLQPPEIAPVGTGTRGTAEDLRPGQLGAPVLNIQAPTSLPEPAGLAAALGALATANMFRDMSGLAGTQATAQAASAGTLDAATEAGRIASANYQAATNQATEMGKAAADMWKVLQGSDKDGSGKQSSAGISGDGAHINQGKDMDRRGLTGGGTGNQDGGGTGSSAANSEQPTSSSGGSGTPVSREVAYSDESAAVSPDLVGGTAAALNRKEDAPTVTAPTTTPLIIETSVTPALRAFEPGRNFTGMTTFSVRGKNLPAGSQLRWSIPTSQAGRYTITQSMAGGVSEVQISGIRPGKSEIDIEAIDGVTVVASVKYPLSIPQFITIDDRHASFGTFITSNNLQGIEDAILEEARRVVAHLLESVANVRILWRSQGRAVPAHIPAAFVTTASILNTDPSGSGDYGVSPPGAGDTVFNEVVTVHPGEYLKAGAVGNEIDTATNDLVSIINGIQASDPELEAWQIRFLGRLIGETTAHELFHTLLPVPFSHNIDGGGNHVDTRDIMDRGNRRSFLERTGIIALSTLPANFLDNLTDTGIGAINRLTGASLDHINKTFPIPPAPPFDKAP